VFYKAEGSAQVLAFFTALPLVAVASHHPRDSWEHADLIVLTETLTACLNLYCCLKVFRMFNGLVRGITPLIVVHGGAGTCPPERSQPVIEHVKTAANVGFDVMNRGGNALDGVVEAVAYLEDSGMFNAGAGAAVNVLGNVELEAAVMDGRTLQAGAAALLHGIKNPVRLARVIMENTDHVFVAGQGAEQIAELFNLPKRESQCQNTTEKHRTYLKRLREGTLKLPRLASLLKEHPEVFQLETVGAVALDAGGNLAAATSTGGFPLKLPGRIGDSPLIGCGTYADNDSGACSATGVGELAIRLVLAKTVCNHIEHGRTPQQAVEDALKRLTLKFSGVYNDMGIIAVDAEGNIGLAHTAPNLTWACMHRGCDSSMAAVTAEFVK
jgi:beta-aspartyl-peptidase (threonine type)